MMLESKIFLILFLKCCCLFFYSCFTQHLPFCNSPNLSGIFKIYHYKTHTNFQRYFLREGQKKQEIVPFFPMELYQEMLGVVNFSLEKFQGTVIFPTENFPNFVTLLQERNCSVMNITELWKIYTPGYYQSMCLKGLQNCRLSKFQYLKNQKCSQVALFSYENMIYKKKNVIFEK